MLYFVAQRIGKPNSHAHNYDRRPMKLVAQCCILVAIVSLNLGCARQAETTEIATAQMEFHELDSIAAPGALVRLLSGETISDNYSKLHKKSTLHVLEAGDNLMHTTNDPIIQQDAHTAIIGCWTCDRV